MVVYVHIKIERKKVMKRFVSLILVLLMLVPMIASCSKVEFKIDFIVDGNTYDSISTSGDEVVTMPQDPTKEGYVFKGWFWDEGVWKKPFTANSLLDAPLSSNMKVYAYFVDKDSQDTEEGDEVIDHVKGENGESIPVVNVSQSVVKNENFLDTEVSWYDDAYNYYVFEVGKILNAPLTATNTVYTYDGGNVSYTYSKTSVTQNSLKVSTSTAVTKSVSFSGTAGLQLGQSDTAGIKDVMSSTVQKGFSASVTGGATTTDVWSNSYEECLTNSTEVSEDTKISFDSSHKKGNYVYLYLGNINVYYAVIQSRTNPEKCYYETFDSISNYRYALVYIGESFEFPTSVKEKIEIDSSFIPNLKTPTNYIKGLTHDVVGAVEKEYYYVDMVDIRGYVGMIWNMEIEDFDKYYAEGYNKIKVDYEFYASGESALIFGCPSITATVSPTKHRDNAIGSNTFKTEKDPKQFAGSVEGDLKWFTKSKTVFFEIFNESLVASVNAGKLKITISLFRSE